MRRDSTVRKTRILRLHLSREAAARMFLLMACLLMVFSAYYLRWDLTSEALLPFGGIFAILGTLALFGAYFLNPAAAGASPDKITDDPLQIPSATSPNYLFIIPGIFALLVLIEVNTEVLHIAALDQLPLGAQLALLILTVMLIPMGLGGFRLFPRHVAKPSRLTQQPTREELGIRWRTVGLLSVITLLAFILRAWNLGMEVHKFVDEIHFASAVMNLRIPDANIKLLAPFSTITSFPWIYPLIQSWFVNFGGRTLESLRWISVILGTLTVPALYFMAKTLIDRKTALVAALLLATFPPHIQFSRIGLNNIADPLFGVLAITFLARGMKKHRRMDFALAGAALGLTQYFYEGGRFLFPILLLLWLAWYFFLRLIQPKPAPQRFKAFSGASKVRSVAIRPDSRRLYFGTFFLTAFLLGLPLYLTLRASNHTFDERFQTVGVGGSYWFRVGSFGSLQTLEQQILRPILIYVHIPETGQYYGGEQPLLLPYVVIFFLLGIAWLLWHWRSYSIILLPWLALTSLGNMLLTDGAISARYVVTFPALMLITAIGICRVLPMLWSPATPPPNAADLQDTNPLDPIPDAPASGSHSKYLPQIVYLLAIGFGVAQVAYFFGPHMATYNIQIRPYYDTEDAIFRAADLPDNTIVHIITDNSLTQGYLSGIMGYLADGKVVYVRSRASINLDYFDTFTRNINLAFFIESDDTTTLAYLQRLYELQGPFRSPYDIDPDKQLLLYYVPGGRRH